MMTLERPEATWIDPKQLNVNEARYLADLLIAHLRDDRWEHRVDKTLTPIESPGEAPGFFSVGVGRTDPLGSSHVLVFTAPKHYELGIDRKHLVILDATDYERWCKREMVGMLPLIDRLIHHPREIRVFVSELSGYGSRQKLKMRRAQSVTREEAAASLEVLLLCSICILGT